METPGKSSVLALPAFPALLLEAYVSLDIWIHFKLPEFHQMERQKDDTLFIDLLNKIRMGNIDICQCCEDILKSRPMQRENFKYPLHVMHILAENVVAKRHNNFMLKISQYF